LINVINGDYTFKDSEWRHVHRQAKHAVGEMLTVDTKVRPSAKQLIESYGIWLKQAMRSLPDKNTTCCVVS
jgi:hypothetical protein